MRNLLFIPLFFLSFLASASVEVSPELEAAHRLLRRMTSVHVPFNDPVLLQMSELIKKGKLKEAALLASKQPGFLDGTVRSFAAPMSQRHGDPLIEFNDFTAFIMGVARDNRDAREILYGDFRYGGTGDLIDQISNDWYLIFEKEHFGELGKNLARKDDQWLSSDLGSGVLTSRAWGQAHYDAGTNRRAVVKLWETFLCYNIEQVKDTTFPEDYIGRDIDRAASGKPQEFQKNCKGCHTGMDALRGAFSRLDFKEGKLLLGSPGTVFSKYSSNSTQFPEGYVTIDDSWENFWASQKYSVVGFTGKSHGKGVSDLGRAFSHSNAFSKCMAKKSIETVCGKEVSLNESADVEALAKKFESSGFQLRELFTEAALSKSCKEDRIKTFREYWASVRALVENGSAEKQKNNELAPFWVVQEGINGLPGTEFYLKRSSLPKKGKIEELSGNALVSIYDIASSVCEKSKDALSTNRNSAEEVAIGMLGRELFDSEKVSLKKALTGIPSDMPAQAESACRYVLSSPKFLIQ